MNGLTDAVVTEYLLSNGARVRRWESEVWIGIHADGKKHCSKVHGLMCVKCFPSALAAALVVNPVKTHGQAR